MAVEKIVTLCKEGDSTTEYYPNIKGDNIPSNAVAKGKLTQALQDEIDGKAPQSTTYTKTEIDNKLSGKVNVATYNAKVSELETAIGTKANASSVYTKTATDTLLSAKANSSDVFTKAETNTLLQNGYYNQTEIDLMLENKADADDVYTKTATDTLLSGKQNKLYKHNITMIDSDGDEFYLSIINNSNVEIDETTIENALINNNITMATGKETAVNGVGIVTYFKYVNNQLLYGGVYWDSNSGLYFAQPVVFNINDFEFETFNDIIQSL